MSLDEDEPEVASATSEPQSSLAQGNERGHLGLASMTRSLRLGRGLSQRQLAGRMGVPRTYVSKIENERTTPTLGSLERLATGLEVTVPELLSEGMSRRQKNIANLFSDTDPRLKAFVQGMLAIVLEHRPGVAVRGSILLQARDLTLRPHRAAM